MSVNAWWFDRTGNERSATFPDDARAESFLLGAGDPLSATVWIEPRRPYDPYIEPRRRPRSARPCCAYCGVLATAIDHVWPKSRGGDDHPNNLVPACRRCNSSKGSRSLVDDCCPSCFESRTPSDLDTARQVAFYSCRCGESWETFWNLQLVPRLP